MKTTLTGLLVFLVLLTSCTNEITEYVVDQETDLHWSCVVERYRINILPHGAWDPDSTYECEESFPDINIVRDTVLVHTAGTVDDATDRCYSEHFNQFLLPALGCPRDSCYCLDEFVF